MPTKPTHTEPATTTAATLSPAELDALAEFLKRVPLQGVEAFTYCQLVARIDTLRRA